MTERKYKVYMHVFPNSKKYIGITCQNCKQRWGSNGNKYKGQSVYKAIKKYGWNNIKHLILYDNLTEEEAKDKEIELIAKYNTTNDKYGYNITKGGDNIMNGAENLSSKKVICINTGEIFDTITQAANKYNIHPTTISKVCKDKRNTAAKMTWQYYDEYLIAPKSIYTYKPVGGINRQVLCVETNTIYDSIQIAAKDIGIDYTAISKACSGKRKTAAKMHWIYIS